MKNSINIETIDIRAKEWFDRVNGNSYWAAQAIINFGTPTEKTVFVPFQYGYGDTYQYSTLQQMQTDGLLPDGSVFSPSRFCRENNIVLRTSKQEKCKKAETVAFGSN